MTSTPEYLTSGHKTDVCYGGCGVEVKQNPETGRWFITMGHPGFNSYVNNRSGYATKETAIRLMRYYGGR